MSAGRHTAKDEFQTQSRPPFWVIKARSLRHSALQLRAVSENELNTLHDYITGKRLNFPASVFYVEHALMGFALEVLLKGLIIMKDPELGVTKKLDRAFRTHKLVKLAKRGEIPLSRTEMELCLNLTNYTEVWFKYPVGRDEEDQHERSIVLIRDGVSCRKVFDELYSRWMTELYPEGADEL